MAFDPAAIRLLRGYIGEPDDAGDYTDERLQTLLDENDGNVEAVAATVWRSKAAALSVLVDISEGASSRKNSQAHSQALRMAEHYGSMLAVDVVEPVRRGARTRAIRRA